VSLSMSSRLARRTGPSTPAHALYTSSHGATECTPAHVREEAWQIPVVESPKRTPDVVATDGIRPRPRLRTAPRWRALTPVRTSAGAPRSHQPLGPIRTVAPEGTLALVAPQPQRTSICFTLWTRESQNQGKKRNTPLNARTHHRRMRVSGEERQEPKNIRFKNHTSPNTGDEEAGAAPAAGPAHFL
jgi:hypothetical protein